MKTRIVILFFICAILLSIGSFLGYRYCQLQSHNECPIAIDTFDGKNSPYHPSVLFHEGGWNGYEFWMAETPFHKNSLPYRDRWECPSIHVSDDGLIWKVPEGGDNPIDDLTNEEIGNLDYFSDPDLVYRDGQLECWYRLTRRKGKAGYGPESKHILCRKMSCDGIHWSERETMLDISEEFHRELGSQSVIYEDDYKMWIVDFDAPAEERVLYMNSSRDGEWENIHSCSLSGHDCNPWHIDVSYFDDTYWLVVYEMTDVISLWKSSEGDDFEYVTTLLQKQDIDGAFDELGYYRACLVKVSDADYRLYYSAQSYNSTHIGVLRGDNVQNMKIVNCQNGDFCSLGELLKMYVDKVRTRMTMTFIR